VTLRALEYEFLDGSSTTRCRALRDFRGACQVLRRPRQTSLGLREQLIFP